MPRKKKVTEEVIISPKPSKDSKWPITVRGYNQTTRNIWERAMKTNSRKTAIRAMCLLCLGGSAKEVKDCSCKDCPLWKYRITG